MGYQKLIPAFGKGFWKSKMFSLMVSLLLLLFVYPLAMIFGTLGVVVLNFAASLVLIFAVFAVSDSKKHIAPALVLGIPAMALRWITMSGGSQALLIANFILHIGFYLYVITLLLKHILKGKKVTANEIYGAVSAYLLFGILWTAAYNLVETILPGSFGREMSGADLLYFSYVTLTTLGYGDISPVRPGVQSLAILEAMLGTLFLTIMVARLVGLYIAHGEK